MFATIYLFILVVMNIFLVNVIGEDCVPMSVTDVRLTFMGMLSWSIREEETCQITHFVVEISQPPEQPRFVIDTEDTTLNVDYLGSCEKWQFNIIPFANGTRGDSHLFVTKVPVPMDADINIGEIDITRPEEEGDLHLQWDLEDPFFGDCSLKYRVTVSGDDNNTITDVYMDEKDIDLHFLSPCVSYEFTVRAINVAEPTLEGPMKVIDYDYPPAVQNPPTPESVSMGATSVNITWSLDSITKNRCPIREFLVEGGDFFRMTIPLHDSDKREPVEVRLTSLRPNTMYLLRASVQNNAGWSTPSILAVQTLNLESDATN